MGLSFDGEQQAKLNFAFTKAPVVGQSSTPSSSSMPAYRKEDNASPRSSTLGFLQIAPSFRKNYTALAPRSSGTSRDSTLLSTPSLSQTHGHHQQQEMSYSPFDESRPVDVASENEREISRDILSSSSHLPRINVANPPSFSNSAVSKGSRHGNSMMHERILRMKKLQADQSRSTPQSSNETSSPWTNDKGFASHSHANIPSLSRPQSDSTSRSLDALARSLTSEPQEQTDIGYPLQPHDLSVLPSILPQSSSASVSRSRSGSVDLYNRSLPLAVLAEALQSAETWNSNNQSMARLFILRMTVSDVLRLIEIKYLST